MTDEQLFADYLGGDECAFTTLHDRYLDPLRRYVKAKTQFCALDVDEIVQRTFCRIVLNKDRFTADNAVKPWLYTIADRLCREAVSC